jgi:DNA invertase Pin-like site-specific DNA recombinase
LYDCFIMRFVVYLRVSTNKQGQSGLGLEAQEHAVCAYADNHASTIIKTFVEIESGKVNDRPKLAEALHLAKVTGATLLIAKLDRLSRNAAFLLTLRDSGVKFVAADLPQANDLTIGIMALVAQQEREAISKRTREALAAARTRGQKLGNPNGAAALRRAGKGTTASRIVASRNADRHARDLLPVIDALRADGVVSLGQLANALNERGMLTPRGRNWHKSSVSNLLKRQA